MSAKINLVRFLLNNANIKSINERQEPYGRIIGSEYCIRVVKTISDGDYLEDLVLQVRPLGRDGETLFYRTSLLYGDDIVQCDYDGNKIN